MPDWSQIGSFLDFCAAYFTTQLVRCAAFSFVLTVIVMLLRKTVFREQIFLKGMLWALFLLTPFLGRLRLFYENPAVLRATWIMTYGTMTWIWADRLYMAGILAAAIRIFGRRLQLCRMTGRMEEMFLNHVRITVTDMHVTPFSSGLLKPKIVIPKVIVQSYSAQELQMIVQHEQTHIRLGHLWFGLLWDILRCLLWVNPFLTIFMNDCREDMEDICDRVSIQNSGRTVYEYGLVLLKTLRLLCPKQEDVLSGTAYAGERDFAKIKRRLEKIAGFRPYRRSMCRGMAGFAFLFMAAAFFMIYACSYARCNESRDIMIGNYDGEAEIVSGNTQELRRMISYDDRFVYVKRESFEDFLRRNHVQGEIWIVFGGFYKLPGLGGVAETCVYESDSKEGIVRIPYDSVMEGWYLEVLKRL